MSDETKERPARGLVRGWIAEWVEASGPTFSIPEAAKAALEHFSTDAVTMRELVEAELYRVFYDLASDVVRDGRVIVFSDGAVVKAGRNDIEAALVEQSRSIFRQWTEHVGNGHKALLAMTKDDLSSAIGLRDKQIADLESRRRFLASLRDGLRGKKTVGEHYHESDLIRLWKRAGGAPKQEAAA